jgi:hypothetical protein
LFGDGDYFPQELALLALLAEHNIPFVVLPSIEISPSKKDPPVNGVLNTVFLLTDLTLPRHLVGVVGFEPTAGGLKARCAT